MSENEQQPDDAQSGRTLDLGVTRHATPGKVALARRLRQGETPDEARVWLLLRNRRLRGLKFRRQQVLFGFVADFYCAELKLAVELDGSVHAGPGAQAYDAARDAALAAHGITVLRLANSEATEAQLLEKIPSPDRERVVSRHSRRAG